MIIQAIDTHLQNRERDKRAIHCFHPSSLHKSVKELLKIYYEGDTNTAFPARILRVFDSNSRRHPEMA